MRSAPAIVLCAALCAIPAASAIAAPRLPEAAVERRLRTSALLVGASVFERESTFEVVRRPLRSRSAMRTFRDQVQTVRQLEHDWLAAARESLPQEAGDADRRETLLATLDVLLLSVEPKLDALLAQLRATEDRMGKKPARSSLSDAQLIETLVLLNITYGQLVRLSDYRELLVAGLRNANVGTPGDRGGQAAKSREAAEALARTRGRLSELDTAHEVRLQLIGRSLGLPEVREGLSRNRELLRQVDHARRSASDVSAPAIEQVRALLVERVGSLEDLAANMANTTWSGARSRLLRPLPRELRDLGPHAAKWTKIQDDLVRSVRARGALLVEIVPQIQKRNRLLRALIDAPRVGGPPARPLMRFLLDMERDLLQELEPNWAVVKRQTSQEKPPPETYYDRLVGLALNLELFSLIESQMLARIESVNWADGVELPDAAARAAVLGELSAVLHAMQAPARRLASLAEQESGVWTRFDAFVETLVAARVRTWEDARARLDDTAGGGGGSELVGILGPQLREALDVRVTESREELKRLRMLREAVRRDPAMKILYGVGEDFAWHRRITDAAYVLQLLVEVTRRDAIAREVAIASDPLTSPSRRGRAFLALVDPLLLSWEVEREGDRLGVAVEVAGRVFVVSDLVAEEPRLSVSRLRRIPAAGRIPSVATAAHYDFVLHPRAIAGWGDSFRGYGSAWWNNWSKRASTSLTSYVILGGTAVVGLGVMAVGAVPVGVAIVTAAASGVELQVAMDVTFTSVHAAIDTTQDGASGENAARLHSATDWSETALNTAQAVGGLSAAGKGLADLATPTEAELKALRKTSEMAQKFVGQWDDLARSAAEKAKVLAEAEGRNAARAGLDKFQEILGSAGRAQAISRLERASRTVAAAEDALEEAVRAVDLGRVAPQIADQARRARGAADAVTSGAGAGMGVDAGLQGQDATEGEPQRGALPDTCPSVEERVSGLMLAAEGFVARGEGDQPDRCDALSKATNIFPQLEGFSVPPGCDLPQNPSAAARRLRGRYAAAWDRNRDKVKSLRSAGNAAAEKCELDGIQNAVTGLAALGAVCGENVESEVSKLKQDHTRLSGVAVSARSQLAGAKSSYEDGLASCDPASLSDAARSASGIDVEGVKCLTSTERAQIDELKGGARKADAIKAAKKQIEAGNADGVAFERVCQLEQAKAAFETVVEVGNALAAVPTTCPDVEPQIADARNRITELQGLFEQGQAERGLIRATIATATEHLREQSDSEGFVRQAQTLAAAARSQLDTSRGVMRGVGVPEGCFNDLEREIASVESQAAAVAEAEAADEEGVDEAGDFGDDVLGGVEEGLGEDARTSEERAETNIRTTEDARSAAESAAGTYHPESGDIRDAQTAVDDDRIRRGDYPYPPYYDPHDRPGPRERGGPPPRTCATDITWDGNVVICRCRGYVFRGGSCVPGRGAQSGPGGPSRPRRGPHTGGQTAGGDDGGDVGSGRKVPCMTACMAQANCLPPDAEERAKQVAMWRNVCRTRCPPAAVAYRRGYAQCLGDCRRRGDTGTYCRCVCRVFR